MIEYNFDHNGLFTLTTPSNTPSNLPATKRIVINAHGIGNFYWQVAKAANDNRPTSICSILRNYAKELKQPEIESEQGNVDIEVNGIQGPVDLAVLNVLWLLE